MRCVGAAGKRCEGGGRQAGAADERGSAGAREWPDSRRGGANNVAHTSERRADPPQGREDKAAVGCGAARRGGWEATEALRQHPAGIGI